MESEIEVKLKVVVEEFLRVEELLIEFGLPPRVEEHCDIYFSRSGGFLEEKYPFEWLSVRQRNGKAVMCYKHFFPEGAEMHTHCNEVSVEVASADAASVLLNSLGFKEVIVVRKTRKAFVYKRTYVALDQVEELGLFIEIEARERSDLLEAHDAVRETLGDLELTLAARDLRGYPYRMLELRGQV